MRRYKQPLKQILGATRDYWDLAEIRPERLATWIHAYHPRG